MADINGTTVIGIQGNPASADALSSAHDGYVVTWDNGNSELKAKPPTGLRKDYFTSNGTWTAPAGVTTIICSAYGGGGGGGGGGCANPSYNNQPTGGAGGGGSKNCISIITVVPGTTYTINIGAGGNGGSGAVASSSGNDGSNGATGGNTEFKNGSTTLFFAAGAIGGTAGHQECSNTSWGGSSNPFDATGASSAGRSYITYGYGGDSKIVTNTAGKAGGVNENGTYTGGSGGTHSGANFIGAGSGGGAGFGGNGANGGAGASTGNGPSGSSASANSGAGGGGGGASPASFTGGNGGNGGSGYLCIVY